MQILTSSLERLSFRRIMSFYAVARGFNVGIYDSWIKCEKQIKGFKGAKYKKFPTREEAENFIKIVTSPITSKISVKNYSPETEAVALGKKGPTTFCWKKGEVQGSEQGNSNYEDTAISNPKEFWHDDDTTNNDITDEDLLTVLEDASKGQVPSASNVRNMKRKCEESVSTRPTKVLKHFSKIWEPVGVRKIGDYTFQIDEEDFVIVYTDGSCINNGNTNACAGYGVYFGENHPLNASKPVTGRVTNNVGEIQAAIHAIRVAKQCGVLKLCLSTDSQFLINAISYWVAGWKRNNWQLKSGGKVKNAIDFKELDKVLADKSITIKWNYVKAHKGIKGNEMADKLAREGSNIYKRLNSKCPK